MDIISGETLISVYLFIWDIIISLIIDNSSLYSLYIVQIIFASALPGLIIVELFFVFLIAFILIICSKEGNKAVKICSLFFLVFLIFYLLCFGGFFLGHILDESDEDKELDLDDC